MPDVDTVTAHLEQTVIGEVSVPDTSGNDIWVLPKYLKNEDEKHGYAYALEQELQARFGEVGTEVLPEGPIVVAVE
jgi:hypothetical protein